MAMALTCRYAEAQGERDITNPWAQPKSRGDLFGDLHSWDNQPKTWNNIDGNLY